MLETLLPCAAACLLLAGASHRYRREAGLPGSPERLALRIGGAALLVVALLLGAAPLDGERVVRFLGGFALGGLLVLLALSAWPEPLLAPVRALVRRRQAARASSIGAPSLATSLATSGAVTGSTTAATSRAGKISRDASTTSVSVA